MKEIKTKQIQKDIKVLDKAMDVSRRAKNAYIRTKEQSEQLGRNGDGNYVDYAGNNIRDGAENIIRKGGHIVENYSKKVFEKMMNRRVAGADAQRSDIHNGESARQTPNSEAKETVSRNAVQTETKQPAQQSTIPVKAKPAAEKKVFQPRAKQVTRENTVQSGTKETTKRKLTLSKSSELGKNRFVQIRTKQQFAKTNSIQTVNKNAVKMQTRETSEYITAQTPQRPLFQPTEKTGVQTVHASGKIGRTTKRAVKTSAKTIKEAARGTIKKTQKAVKSAERTSKTAIKTPQTATKTAVKTAQATRRAVQAARAATRAAAVSAKRTVKAMVATIKAIILAAKGLIALIAAGGWIAVVIILIMCLAGLLLGSGFGIFFSNENSGENTPTMTAVVNQLNREFSAELERIQNENLHDTLELSYSGNTTACNWLEILPVYAVEVAADTENGMEVTTLDDTKVGILQDIFWDMNEIDYWIEIIEYGEPPTTEIILHIIVTSKNHVNMIADYDFNSDQVNMLNELMQDEYQQLFMQLIDS
ncbi:hypothetical protein [Petroclostridium sp. X23]|uniref:hypothetical protein n=1 Tax=Petroclostridium sp. X23 TaxID=3045146 RepID=UPI0024ACAF64|nr:hypothetical protein [Petroclostridium sp. X23]WHH60012.1 hypothetical protein QKW49_04475 [Petroclostridium sp. X23]